MTSPGQLLNTIRLTRGQTKVLLITVKDQEGRPASLSGATIYFTARRDYTSDVVIEKNSPDNGIEITDAAKGEAVITLSSTDTEVQRGTYRYDCWVEFPGTPPIRHPVVKYADLCVEDRLTTF